MSNLVKGIVAANAVAAAIIAATAYVPPNANADPDWCTTITAPSPACLTLHPSWMPNYMGIAGWCSQYKPYPPGAYQVCTSIGYQRIQGTWR